MRHRVLWGIFGFVCAASTGRATPTEGEVSIHCDAESGLCFRVEARDVGCGARTWVRPALDGTCPGGVPGLRGRWALLERGPTGTPAADVCRYAWTSRGGHPPEAPALAALRDRAGRELAPDCEVVATSGGAIDVTWPELQRAFFEQTDRVDPLPAGAAPKTPVRVEIVDSAVTRRAPDGEPSHGRLEHGRAMGLIVRSLGCPSPGAGCRADVASTLALPLVRTPSGVVRDPARGGTFGSFMDLAAAIDDAVSDWRRNAPAHRLIINLSLGWEPAHGGDYTSPQQLSAPIRAVWSAIARARCLGAAVVVATGNRVEGPDAPTGPMYPAGWATKPAPSPSTCRTLGAIGSSSLGSTAPLVFAVGGVEPNDTDLGMGRADARPEWVAPAAHAVVEDGRVRRTTSPHTGTSVAAAVTSAAAAVVWSYRPALTADEVMDVLYAGGVDLGRGASICSGGSPCSGTAHRVSVCGALREACATGRGTCPTSLPACAPRPRGRSAYPRAVNLASLSLPAPVSARSVVPIAPIGWPCDGFLNATHAAVANPCPASQLPAPPSAALVTTQTGDEPACPHCALNPTAMELYVEIDSGFSGVLTDPVLTVVVDSSIGDVRYFDLSAQLPTMVAGDQAVVEDLDIGAPSFESATVEFVVDGAYSNRSPVMHWD